LFFMPASRSHGVPAASQRDRIRARIWGITACVIAIVPNVLVSKISRTIDMGVASKAPSSPMPALFTSTSMGPAASIAAAMLSGFMTSSATIRIRSDAGSTSSRGVRMVATTFQPCQWK